MQKKSFITSMILLSLSLLFVSQNVKAQKISKTKKAGKVSITLKVLPAEHFKGSDAEMQWDAGADPNLVGGKTKPNHHLVAFVKEDKKPLEKADVIIRYRQLSPKKGDWLTLPVARMHVAGKSLETTHYGNNVWLAKGKYEASVKVNDNPPAMFHFTLKK